MMRMAVKGSVPSNAALWIDNLGGGRHSPAMARKLRLQYPGAVYHLMSRASASLVKLVDSSWILAGMCSCRARCVGICSDWVTHQGVVSTGKTFLSPILFLIEFVNMSRTIMGWWRDKTAICNWLRLEW